MNRELAAVISHRRVLPAMLAAMVLAALTRSGWAAEPKQIYISPATPVELRFVAIDPAHGAIDEHWLLNEITMALQARSGWPLKSSGTTTTEWFGLRTRLEEDRSQIVFQYVHVARNRVGEEWGETLSLPVSYQVQRSNVLFLIRLAPPTKAELAKLRMPGVSFLPTPKLRPIEELVDDFISILESAETLELHHAFLFDGEVDAVGSPERCLKKFEYVLGRYAYARNEQRVFDPRHDDVFLFRTARESVPLKIIASNNRGGSRIFYEAWLPFELRADGTVGGYDLASSVSSEINRVLHDTPTREAAGAPDNVAEDGRSRDRR
jgi:hypothetical protein